MKAPSVEAMLAILALLGAMLSGAAALLWRAARILSKSEEVDADHERRIRRLERKFSPPLGQLAVRPERKE